LAISWRQYSGPEKFRIFLVSPGQIPVISGGKLPEVGGIISRFSGPEYCFHFRSILGTFLPQTVIFPELSSRFRSFAKVGIIGLV
jgi:hypothetical protein